VVGNAEKNAGQAKAQAEQLLAEVNADAERRRAATHREVDDLTRQARDYERLPISPG
jgi:hypothetical protein